MTPVVFIHGFMGGSQQWQAQSEAFNGANVIALDLPGYGHNAGLASLDSIDEIADWALDDLTARGVDRFHLIGHSMGGMIVQDVIKRAPERVEKLVLYGTGAAGVLPGRFETIETSKRRAVKDGPQVTARRIAATWFLDREQAAGYEGCAAIAEQCRLPTMLNGLDAMENWNGVAHLQNIEAKTLVVWGDGDRTYPWQQTEQLWHSIPNANLSVIAGCAHAAHLEKPALFNCILGDFLAA